jgi:hypothetical protein
MSEVTERQAQEVFAAVREQFKGYLEPVIVDGRDYGPPCPEPKLVLDYQGDSGNLGPAVVWEDGPSDWAYLVHEGGASEEDRALAHDAAQEFKVAYKAPAGVKAAKLPTGVWVEPIFSFVLGIYPND